MATKVWSPTSGNLDGRFKKGVSPWNKGKKMTPEYCTIVAKSHAGKTNAGTFVKGHPKVGNPGRKVGSIPWNKGIRKVKENMREMRSCAEYKEWNRAVRIRDDTTCQLCLNKYPYNKLHSHHIKSFSKHSDDRFNVDNGMTLCIPCHKYVHSKVL